MNNETYLRLKEKFGEERVNEFFIYLDTLRDSGVTNMYGAGTYIRHRFEVSVDVADSILSAWMRTFAERHPEEGR